jgi:hypothetical protein
MTALSYNLKKLYIYSVQVIKILMEYVNFIMGVGLFVAFTWIFVRNRKRSGWLHALLRIDTITGIVAGLYLVLTSVHALL